MATDPNAPVDERRVAAWIGRALRIEGRIVSNENLTIDGQVEGTIEVGNHTLTIGAGAAVKADLSARSIMISGTVNGDIVAPRLVMDDGAIVSGKVEAGKKREPVAG